jgi:hypothetical protein
VMFKGKGKRKEESKHRNLNQFSPERRALLEATLNQSEGPITPLKARSIVEADPNDLKAVIDKGVLALTIAELLERARIGRGVGVRKLARRLNQIKGCVRTLGCGDGGSGLIRHDSKLFGRSLQRFAPP